MLDEVRRFMRREGMPSATQPLWVAVSGGIDSMVLLHVLRALGYACSVAHVDHGLRGAASEGDRLFVEDYCRSNGLPFRSHQVDVGAHAEAHGLSTQVAGREVRYGWFQELWEESPMPIAMGHHADDAVESLFIELLRGTGVHGWSTIRPVSGIHVRPLLCVGRQDIARYAAEHQVGYREDASNADPKYLRNRIRHELLPLLDAMRPGALRTMARSLGPLRELEEAGRNMNLEGLAGITPDAAGTIRVPFERIERSPTPGLVLHRLLRHLGFHPDMLDRVRDAIISRHTGARFTAGPWQVCVDREELIISRRDDELPAYVIDPGRSASVVGPFRWMITEGTAGRLDVDPNVALLDADRLLFPLELRPWRHGDRIRPLGLGGSKLVSDVLIDAKVAMNAKVQVYVLLSGEEIVWVSGHRIAEGYQLTSATREVFRIEQDPLYTLPDTGKYQVGTAIGKFR